MKKTVIIVLIIAVLGGIGAYFYVFHKPHRDVTNEEASMAEQANMLVDKFREDAATANTVYLDEVVEVMGIAAEVHPDHILLEGGVYCTMAEDAQNPTVEAGTPITVKGRVVGYDDLFEELKMDFCQLTQ
jgi:predicted RNA-binding protein Jag